jgi:hypothetical protein
MPLMPFLTCGTLTKGSYCPQHRPVHPTGWLARPPTRGERRLAREMDDLPPPLSAQGGGPTPGEREKVGQFIRRWAEASRRTVLGRSSRPRCSAG